MKMPASFPFETLLKLANHHVDVNGPARCLPAVCDAERLTVVVRLRLARGGKSSENPTWGRAANLRRTYDAWV
jgi:hypothetical protein